MSSWTAGSIQHEAEELWPFSYWYQGVFLTQWRVKPASVRILMEAASASLTVSFTDCIRFWALCTNISVAWWRRREKRYNEGDNNPNFKGYYRKISGIL